MVGPIPDNLSPGPNWEGSRARSDQLPRLHVEILADEQAGQGVVIAQGEPDFVPAACGAFELMGGNPLDVGRGVPSLRP
jgi:hypothetical protein